MRPRPADVLVIASTFPRHPDDPTGRFVGTLVGALPHRRVVVCPDDPAVGDAPLPDVPRRFFRNAGVFYGAGALANLHAGASTPLGRLATLASLASTALAAARDARVVFSHWAVPGGVAGALCRLLLRRPHACLLHSADVHWLETRRAGRLVARFVSAQSDALCAVSDEVAARFERLTVRRARVLGCGVADPWAGAPTDAIVDARRARVARDDVRRAGTLSRLAEGKGVLELLDAWDGRPGVELLVAGDGPLRARVEARCADHPRARAVGALVGAAKRAWLRELDLFVAPYARPAWGQAEGLPVAVLEALAAGLPVVACAGALPASLCRAAGEAVRTVAADDPRALVAACRALLDDDAARARLVARARAAAAPYALAHVAAEWTALLDGLGARGARDAERDGKLAHHGSSRATSSAGSPHRRPASRSPR